MNAKKPDRVRSALTTRLKPLHPNPAVANLIAQSSEDAERKFAERAAWFEANAPLSAYGPKFCSRDYEYTHRGELELQRFTVEYLKRQLYQLDKGGLIRSVSVREPGSTRGCRLFRLASILAYIERCASGEAPEKEGG